MGSILGTLINYWLWWDNKLNVDPNKSHYECRQRLGSKFQKVAQRILITEILKQNFVRVHLNFYQGKCTVQRIYSVGSVGSSRVKHFPQDP